jgi:drug/metabolite transporter (DMT)-like permease
VPCFDQLGPPFSITTPGTVSPFDFGRLSLTAFFGFIFLSEIPDMWSILGALITIAASLYIAPKKV